jgi:hypothetical protein
MRKLLILAILGSCVTLLHSEETVVVPDFRPAKVELTTNGAVAPSNISNRIPDGMTTDLPVETDPNVHLNKIYTYLNDLEKNRPPKDNAMLIYESKYWNHGAVLEKDKQAKKGNIFVINWQNNGRPENLTVRLDYRQANTRERVMTKTQEYKDFEGYEKTVIKVTGDDYLRGGVVNSWRISIVRDGKIVAQEKSFIW